jgi:hypothetical protein
MKTLRSTRALLTLTALAGLCSVPAGWAAEQTAVHGRDMAIVAHQDDDLLFMNPDIMHAIQANHAMLTVFLTAGDAGLPASYWAGAREPGSRAAYATMAGVTASDSSWQPIYPALPFTFSVKIDQMIRPKGKAPIYLAFVRLPATYESGQSADPSQIFPGAWDSLRMLWMGQIIEMDELVDPNGATDPTNYPGLPYHGLY